MTFSGAELDGRVIQVEFLPEKNVSN